MLLFLWNRQSIISYIPQIYHLRFGHVGITYIAFHMPCFLSWGMGELQIKSSTCLLFCYGACGGCKTSISHACFFAMGHAEVAKRSFRMPAFLLWGMRELQNDHFACLRFCYGACGGSQTIISHACISAMGHAGVAKRSFHMPAFLLWDMRELQNVHPTCLRFCYGACEKSKTYIPHALFSIMGHAEIAYCAFPMLAFLSRGM